MDNIWLVVKEYSEKIYEMEYKRQESLLLQAERLLVVQTLLTTIFFSQMEFLCSKWTYDIGLLKILLMLVFIIVMFSLILLLLAMGRYKYMALEDIDINKICKTDGQVSTKDICIMWYERYSELAENLKSNNDVRVRLVQIDMYLLIVMATLISMLFGCIV